MDVILMEHIQGVGKMGEVANVSRGFARNYLLPRKKALLATQENLSAFEAQRKELEAGQAKAKSAAEAEAVKFEELSITLSRQASETGQLYGSIKARDIEAALAEKGLQVERQSILIGNPIKEVGEHTVRIALHPEVVVDIKVEATRQSL